MIEFKNINFGLAAGEAEASRFPDLVRKGFFDDQGIINELIHGYKYLVLGHKGSGKSLIGEKLLFNSKEDNQFFCEKIMLADFPFVNFTKILPGKSEENNNYPKSWSLVILISILNQLVQNGTIGEILNNFTLISSLKEMGLLASSDFRNIVTKASQNKFKVGISALSFESNSEKNYQTNFEYLLNNLKYILTQTNPQNKHILVIDGLDDFLMLKEVQYQSLGGLVYEIGNLNNFFFSNGLNYKIILLCRIDLFERFPIPNKNKQRQDAALEINWYHDTRNPQDSNLIKLANIRANLSDSMCEDVFKTFFPSEIRGKTAIQFLLENTRHTPRDFIQMLRSIQKFSNVMFLTEDNILSGLGEYSVNYFLPEIKDEITGYINLDKFEIFLQCLGSFRDREISIHKLIEKCKPNLEYQDVINILKALFECSAIGNKFHGLSAENMYCFRYRNRNCTYNPDETIVIHQGLLKALGII